MPDKSTKEVPCGLVIWAAGNKGRKITQDLMGKLAEFQTNRRGITVDDYLRMQGANDIYAIGDCTASSYAPTAQVASQQGAYLGRMLNLMGKRDTLQARLAALGQLATSTTATADEQKALESEVREIEGQLGKLKLRPFHYSHQGSLAYIGSDRAIADLPFMNGNFATGGVATYLFWRSAYLSTLFSTRNRILVATDWIKVKLFGRDVSRD